MPNLFEPNKCNYEFTRGAKKGTQCGKACINERCGQHSNKCLEKKRKYYHERKDEWRVKYPNLYVDKQH